MRLALVPPYPAGTVLAWLAARAVPGVEKVAGSAYRRVLTLPGGPAVVELEPRADHVAATIEPAAEDACRRLLDLDLDPAQPAAVLSADAALAPLLQCVPGVRVPGAVDRFETVVRTVLGQQVSLAAARSLAARLVAAFGTPLEPDGALTHAFPTAAQLAAADLERIGMPGARRAALAELARRVASGALDLGPGRPTAEITADLIEVPGIGPWTASYVALRALGDRDAFPAGDLGLQRAARALGLPGDAARLAAHAERWHPWCAHAAQLLWASANPSRMRDVGTGNQGRTE